MPMTQNDWNVIRGAIGAILLGVDNPDDVSIPDPVPTPTTVKELALYMLGVKFEIEIGNALNFTFQALEDAGAALAKAHDLAAAVVVADPTQANIDEITSDLNAINAAVQRDQRFDGAVALAVAIVGIVKNLPSASNTANMIKSNS
jgi:hypothetical protein